MSFATPGMVGHTAPPGANVKTGSLLSFSNTGVIDFAAPVDMGMPMPRAEVTQMPLPGGNLSMIVQGNGGDVADAALYTQPGFPMGSTASWQPQPAPGLPQQAPRAEAPSEAAPHQYAKGAFDDVATRIARQYLYGEPLPAPGATAAAPPVAGAPGVMTGAQRFERAHRAGGAERPGATFGSMSDESVHKGLRNHQKHIKHMDVGLLDHKQHIQNIDTGLRDHKTHITHMDTGLRNHKVAIEGVKTSVNDLRERVGALEVTGSAGKEVKELRKRIDKLEGKFDTKLKSVEETVSGFSDNKFVTRTCLDAELQPLHAKTRALESSVVSSRRPQAVSESQLKAATAAHSKK